MSAPMPVAEREHLAQQYAAELAPKLWSAIDERDAESVAELIGELNQQELFALVVVLASQWPTKRKYRGKQVTCWGCGNKRRHAGHGLCGGCVLRWDRAGRPESGPPPAMTLEEAGKIGAARRQERKAERLEDFADLASWGVSDEEAAERLGVSPWTVAEYKTELARTDLQLSIPGERRRAS